MINPSLEILGEAPRTGKQHRRVWVRCACGKQFSAQRNRVQSGVVRSCGCLRAALVSTKLTRHGRRRTPEYSSWVAMKSRCTNPNDRCWHKYGARGVLLCDRWHTFQNFFDDMGPRPPGTSIDRIDNLRGYEPGNCRWATPAQQAHNRGKPRTNTTGFKGVTREGSRFVAKVQSPLRGEAGARFGSYDTPEEAARAYDMRSIALFGEFASLNFPESRGELLREARSSIALDRETHCLPEEPMADNSLPSPPKVTP